MSIVELMIGIAISLFIVAGATLVLTSQLSDNRRLLLETQVQQDLRATTDLIARDLKKAGYWGNAHRNVWPDVTSTVPLANPYRSTTPAGASPANNESLEYSRSDFVPPTPVDDDIASGGELAGFKLDGNTIKMKLGVAGNWQELTDPKVIKVTKFTIEIKAPDQPASEFNCSVGYCTSPLNKAISTVVRNAEINIEAVAVHDSTVRRSLKQKIRLRNDLVVEAP